VSVCVCVCVCVCGESEVGVFLSSNFSLTICFLMSFFLLLDTILSFLLFTFFLLCRSIDRFTFLLAFSSNSYFDTSVGFTDLQIYDSVLLKA
jgi:hypothetical protein